MIKIDKSEYFNSNGKNPKGFGYWLFSVNGHIISYTDNYSTAVKKITAIVKEAKPRTKEIINIIVCP